MADLTRLTPRARRTLQVLGPLLLLLGLGLFFFAGYLLMQAPGAAAGDANRFEAWRSAVMAAAGLAVVGMLLSFVGGVAIRFGYLKPIAEIVATEASGALAQVGGAVGRGVAGAGRGGGKAVRVRCRSCRSLELETATFYSACGVAM